MKRLAATLQTDVRVQLRNGFYLATAFVVACSIALLHWLPNDVAALLLGGAVAAGLGALYLLGRLLYLVSYVKDPKSRSLGFALSSGPIVLLMLGALVGAARAAWLHL